MRINISLLIILFCKLTIGQSDFTLSEAIDYAIEHSSEMRIAELDVMNADAQITEFKSIGLPQISGRLNYQYYLARPVSPVEDFITPTVYQVLEFEDVAGVDPFVGPPDLFEFSFFQKNNISANIDASLLLFDGSYTLGLKAIKLFKDLTKKTHGIKEEEIAANVTKAYMNILIAEKNKEMLSQNIDILEKSLTETEAMYKSGFMEQLDVDRIKLSLENIKTEYVNVEQLIEGTKDLLKYQMSYPLNNNINVSENLEDLVDAMKISEDIPLEKIDYNKRAEYSQIDMNKSLGELNVERLKKEYLPSMILRANINESLQRDNLFDSDAIGWIPQASVSLGINVPIYDGNEKKGKIKQAEIALEKIHIQKQEFERAVRLQIKSAMLQLSQANRTLDNRKYALSIVESIYKKTQIKFREGIGSSVELIQAEQQLNNAQSNYISALYNLLISKTDLDIAVGDIK